jgi:Mg-chelatase subunit ChlD
MSDDPLAGPGLEQRWRLVLGRYSERQLGGLRPEQQSMDDALDFLYGRLYENRGVRSRPGERGAGLEASNPSIVDWLDAIHLIFPDDVCERIEAEAVDRFGMTEILTDPRALDRVEPSEDLLRVLLALRHRVQPAALAAVRRVVAAVVEQITRRLELEVQSVLTGRLDQHRRTHRNTGALDAKRTIERNLHTWDPDRRRLLIERLEWFDRTKLRYPWDVILCIDQSGSMAGSVMNSAVLAGILSKLPGVTVKIVVFDTSVVDLSHLVDDPVETLLAVQLGGGTDIAQALQYVEQLVQNPTRTVVALITDFYEGGSVSALVASARRLAEARVTTLGLAALEDGAGPAYDHGVAERLAATGMQVAAMSPRSFAEWLVGVMR